MLTPALARRTTRGWRRRGRTTRGWSTRGWARSWSRAGVSLALMLGGLVVGVSGTAHAGVGPCDNLYVCVVVGSGGRPPGGTGGGGGGGGAGGGACLYNGTPMACYVPGIGWLSNDGCYYMEMQPQPPAGDPLWQGHRPGDGAVYIRTCALNAGGGTVSLWLAATPPMPPQMTPGELAAWAVARIPRAHAVIRSAPGNGQHGLVKSPVMLWIDRTGNDFHDTWVPSTHKSWAQASVPGLSVTAWVWSTQVSFDTGDGTVVCRTPGAVFQKTFAGGCSHSYGTANDAYVVTAVVSWHVHWRASTGATGDFDLDGVTSRNYITLKIDELQVLN